MNGKNSKIAKIAAGLALAGMATFGVAACGSSDSSSTTQDVSPIASVQALTGATTAIKLDSGFVDALGTLKLTPGVTGTAKLTDGSLIFPITGGNVNYYKPGTVEPYVQGQIQHEGSGLSLTAGSTAVTLTNFNVDPGSSKVYGDVSVNGKLAVASAYLFNLDGSTLMPLQSAGNTAILEGTKVYISPVAAGLLNSTFGTKAVTDKLLVGVAKITINVK